MDTIFSVFPFLVLFILLWFYYTSISLALSVRKFLKEDSTLESCLSTTGKYVYIGIIVIYIVVSIVGITTMFIAYTNKNNDLLLYVLNGLTLTAFGCSYLLQQIIFVGHRQMLIGKIRLDYRKIKRATFPKASKLYFVYGQKNYQTSLWFIDQSKLKKALQKSK